MKTSKTILCAILTIVFIFAGAASAYYNVIDLGALDGYPASSAWSINDDGQIVGWDVNDPVLPPGYPPPQYQYERACLFDNTGGGANINLGSGGALCSDGDRIVGKISYYDPNRHSHSWNYFFSYGYDYSRACLFDSTGSGANIDLGVIGGIGTIEIERYSSGAQSVNNSGQIVGWAQNRSKSIYPSTSYYERACLFDNTGGGANKDLKTLGGYESGYESEALSNNDSSKIVGWADNSSSYERACIFDNTGGGANRDLGSLGGDCSMAWSINNNNQIVGWALDSLDNYHACLFDPTGGGANKDLGTLGGDGSEAYCINDDGEIAGYALDSSGQSRACIFDSTGSGNNIDLNTRIDPNSGWTLLYASSIDNEGWIVGQGINSLGQTHAFLLLPEPPIRARVFICPHILNLRDCDRWVTCYIWLPRGYKVADINPASILLEDEIRAEWTKVMRGWQFMIVKFSRSEVEDIVAPGWVKLTVSGKLVNGRKFEGTDTIRVMGKPKHKCWKWPRKCKHR